MQSQFAVFSKVIGSSQCLLSDINRCLKDEMLVLLTAYEEIRKRTPSCDTTSVTFPYIRPYVKHQESEISCRFAVIIILPGCALIRL